MKTCIFINYESASKSCDIYDKDNLVTWVKLLMILALALDKTLQYCILLAFSVHGLLASYYFYFTKCG